MWDPHPAPPAADAGDEAMGSPRPATRGGGNGGKLDNNTARAFGRTPAKRIKYKVFESMEQPRDPVGGVHRVGCLELSDGLADRSLPLALPPSATHPSTHPELRRNRPDRGADSGAPSENNDDTDLMLLKARHIHASHVFCTDANNHGDMAYHSPGLVAAPLAQGATTVVVYRAPKVPHHPQLPWEPGRPGSFKGSTATGNATTITANGTVTSYLIPWLRTVGDEYVKITHAAVGALLPISLDPPAVLTVQRGLWGSSPVAHPANSTVLAPIYHSKAGWPDAAARSSGTRSTQPRGGRRSLSPRHTPRPTFSMGCGWTASGRPRSKRSTPGAATWGSTCSTSVASSRPSAMATSEAQRVLVGRVRALIERRGATQLYANNVDGPNNAPELIAPGFLLDGGASEAGSGLVPMLRRG